MELLQRSRGRHRLSAAVRFQKNAGKHGHGHGQDEAEGSPLRAALFGGQEGPQSLGSYINDYHSRGFGKWLTLIAATTQALFNNVAHILSEGSSNDGEDNRKVMAASGAGLAGSSIPTALTYLLTGDPNLSSVTSGGTFTALGGIAAGVEERDESGKSPKLFLKSREFYKKLVTNVGIQLGAGLSAMGLAQYGGEIVERVTEAASFSAAGTASGLSQLGGQTIEKISDGVSFATAAANTSGIGFMGLGVAVIAGTIFAKRLFKRSELGYEAGKHKFTRRDARRASMMAGQEGAQMAGVNSAFAAGLGLSPKVAGFVTLYQSIVNGLIHAGGEATSNPDGKRLKSAAYALGAIAATSVLPLGAFALFDSFIASGIGSVVSLAGLGGVNAALQAKEDNRKLSGKDFWHEVARQVRTGATGIWLAHVGGVGVQGAIAGGVSGAMGAIATSGVAIAGGIALGTVAATRRYMRKKKYREHIGLIPGSMAWRKVNKRLSTLEYKADVQRGRLGLSGWEKDSDRLRELRRPNNVREEVLPEERDPNHREVQTIIPYGPEWIRTRRSLIRVEETADSLRRRMGIRVGEKEEGWERISARLRSLHTSPKRNSASSMHS